MNEAIRHISCIILAGGQGKRAGGTDKGLLQYHKQTLIEHVLHAIKPQVDDIVISANRNISRYRQYSDVVINDDSNEFLGPLSGIATCLPHCKHDVVLIIACDMPDLPNMLVQRLQQDLQDNAIAIATVNNKHQLSLLVHKNLQPSLQQRLNNNQLKLIQWVESVPYASVSFNDVEKSFLNVNTLAATNE